MNKFKEFLNFLLLNNNAIKIRDIVEMRLRLCYN